MKKIYTDPKIFEVFVCAEKLICDSLTGQGSNETFNDPQEWGGTWN